MPGKRPPISKSSAHAPAGKSSKPAGSGSVRTRSAAGSASAAKSPPGFWSKLRASAGSGASKAASGVVRRSKIMLLKPKLGKRVARRSISQSTLLRAIRAHPYVSAGIGGVLLWNFKGAGAKLILSSIKFGVAHPYISLPFIAGTAGYGAYYYFRDEKNRNKVAQFLRLHSARLNLTKLKNAKARITGYLKNKKFDFGFVYKYVPEWVKIRINPVLKQAVKNEELMGKIREQWATFSEQLEARKIERDTPEYEQVFRRHNDVLKTICQIPVGSTLGRELTEAEINYLSDHAVK